MSWPVWVVTAPGGRWFSLSSDEAGAREAARLLPDISEIVEIDVEPVVLGELERIKEGPGLVLAVPRDAYGMGLPVWVVQFTDGDGLVRDWPVGTQWEAERAMASPPIDRDGSAGVFLFDAFHAVAEHLYGQWGR